MSREKEISTLSLAVLGLISQAPLTGYDLRKIFSTTPMGHFSSSPGAIYPALKRLEKQGWIAGTVENPDTLRPRQVFRLTPTGSEVLKRALSQPVTSDDIIWRLDDLLLRFSFMGHNVAPQDVLRFLGEFAAAIESYVPELKQHLDAMPPQMRHGRFALENGIEQYEAQARWARRVIAQFERNDPTEGGGTTPKKEA